MSTQQNPKLLDEVRQLMRLKRYSIHTERNYCAWIIQFVRFHNLKNKEELNIDGEVKIEKFLTYLAIQRNVATSTQNQAMKALVF